MCYSVIEYIGVVSVFIQYMVYMVYNCVYYCDTPIEQLSEGVPVPSKGLRFDRKFRNS
jgi:hypothetical protein